MQKDMVDSEFQQDAYVSDESETSSYDESAENTSQRKVGKPRKDVTREDIEQYLHLPQQEAAVRLKVSVSTLKRRYQEFFNTKARWPSPAQRNILAQKKKLEENKQKAKLRFVLNYKPKSWMMDMRDEKVIDERAMTYIMSAFQHHSAPVYTQAQNTAFRVKWKM